MPYFYKITDTKHAHIANIYYNELKGQGYCSKEGHITALWQSTPFIALPDQSTIKDGEHNVMETHILQHISQRISNRQHVLKQLIGYGTPLLFDKHNAADDNTLLMYCFKR